MPASIRLWGFAALVLSAAGAMTCESCSRSQQAPLSSRTGRERSDRLDAREGAPLAWRFEPATFRAVPPDLTCSFVEQRPGGAVLRCVTTRHTPTSTGAAGAFSHGR
jgi:hypothetical protein